MIAELKTLLVPYNKDRLAAAYQRILFPEPAENQDFNGNERPTRREDPTVASDPQ